MADNDDLPAEHSPGVGSALGKYRNRGLSVLLVGGALLVVFVVAASVVENRAEQLEQVGLRVDGTVVEVNPGLRSAGNIHVAFVHRNRQRRSVVHLNDSSPRYEAGQAVTVLVDPTDEERVSLSGETNQSRLTVVPMILALVVGLYATIVGGSMIVRSRRQRRVLRANPWRLESVDFRFRQDNGTGTAAVRLAGEHLLLIASSLRRRIERSGLAATSPIEVAGDPLDYLVLRTPGSDVLSSGRPPRSRWARRRWRHRFQ